jgi:hypothetical protein
MCAVPWGTIGRFFAGLLPLVIGGVVTYIAWAQYQINRRQYRLALFERRIAIYNALTARCAAVVEAMSSDLQGNIKFIRATRDHEFLFGPEVGTFVNEIWKQGNRLMTLQAVEPRRPDQESVIVDWFSIQISEARKIFSKYMDFTDDY